MSNGGRDFAPRPLRVAKPASRLAQWRTGQRDPGREPNDLVSQVCSVARPCHNLVVRHHPVRPLRANGRSSTGH
jgi:hypothetical protein